MGLEQILEFIAIAEDDDITKMAVALVKRQKKLYPDWEAMYLSFPLAHPDECRQIMQRVWEILMKIKEEEASAAAEREVFAAER